MDAKDTPRQTPPFLNYISGDEPTRGVLVWRDQVNGGLDVGRQCVVEDAAGDDAWRETLKPARNLSQLSVSVFASAAGDCE